MEEQNNYVGVEQTEPVQQSGGKRKWVLVSLITITTIAIIYVFISLLMPDPADENALIYPSYDKLPTKSDPTTVTTAVHAALSKKYNSERVAVSMGETAPFWHADGDETLYVTYIDNDASSLKAGYDDLPPLTYTEIQEDRTGIIDTINASLKKQGFIPIEDSPYGKLSDVWYYDSMLCVVDAVGSGQVSSPVNLKCGSLYWYNTSFSGYPNARIFSNAYKAAGNKVKEGDVFNVDSDKESTTEGYRKARVLYSNVGNGGEAELLFYKKGDASWKFFKAIQSYLPCTAYNTTDLKAAFKDDTCYDEKNKKDSTVQ